MEVMSIRARGHMGPMLAFEGDNLPLVSDLLFVLKFQECLPLPAPVGLILPRALLIFI